MSIFRKTHGKELTLSKRKPRFRNKEEEQSKRTEDNTTHEEEPFKCAENNTTNEETDIKKPVFTRVMLYFLIKGKKIYEYECSENNLTMNGRHYPKDACGICGKSLNQNHIKEFCDTLGNSFFCCTNCERDYEAAMCLKSYYPLESKYIFANKFTSPSLDFLNSEIKGESRVKTGGVSSSAFMTDEEFWFYDRFALWQYSPTTFSAFWDAFNKAIDEIELRENMNVKHCSNDEKLCLILKYGQKSLKEDDVFRSDSYLCTFHDCDGINESTVWKCLLDTDYKFCAFFYFAFPINFEKAFIDLAKQYFDVEKYFEVKQLPANDCATNELNWRIRIKFIYHVFFLRIEDEDAANELLTLDYYMHKYVKFAGTVVLIQFIDDDSRKTPVLENSQHGNYLTYYNYITKTVWADYYEEYPGSADDAATYIYRAQREFKE